MKTELIKKIMDIRYLGKRVFIPLIVKAEGGEAFSKLLREYTNNKYNVNVGMFSYGGCFAPEFNIGGGVKVGKYCSFASNIKYYAGNHPVHYATTSPFFYNKQFGKFEVKDIERNQLKIGNDVWIGASVIITAKCKNIGNGAVIGAGSVVTKDVLPYTIVAGNPVKLIRYRFDTKTIIELEKSKWWELDPKELLKYYELISTPFEFANKIIKDRFEGIYNR